MRFLAKTFSGLENVLKDELVALEAQNVEVQTRAVSFEANKEILYKANYLLRTALRILLPLAEFTFEDVEQYYEKIKQIEFENYFDTSKTFNIDAVVKSTFFNNTHFAALKAKDAIVDRFREKTGNRPNVDRSSSQIVVNVYVNENFCTVSLDMAGEPLYKRSYRHKATDAPLNEVLAAGIIGLSRWNKKTPFVDFMCGSGTLPIEAAMFAYNIPAQILRKNFSFFHFNDFDKSIWEKILKEAKQKQSAKFCDIRASDISPKAVDFAAQNMTNLGLSALIDTKRYDFTKTKSDNPCHIVINPPYWKRIEGQNKNSVEDFYKAIGDTLKNNYKGSVAWIFTGNLQALKHIGLKHSEKIILFNGSIESRLVKYELY